MGNLLLKIKLGFRKISFKLIDFLLVFYNYKNTEKNILIVKIDRIGDFILFSPSLKYLRRKYPDYKISIILSPATKIIAENLNQTDNIIIFDRNKFENNFLYRFNILKQIRLTGFEKVIYPNYSREPIGDYLVKVSGAKERVGFDGDTSNTTDLQKDKNNKNYTFLIKSHPKATHEAERNKEFLKNLGIQADDYEMDLNISKKEDDYVKSLLQDTGDKKIIVIAPGAGDPKRYWGVEKFSQLAQEILKYYSDSIVIIVGGKSDKELGKKIYDFVTEKNRIIDATGNNLIELFALLKKANVYIGNDTGTLHFASMAKVPVVAISCHPQNGIENHANSPLRFGPYKVPSIVLQPKPDEKCQKECNEKDARFINKITTEDVFEAVKKLL